MTTENLPGRHPLPVSRGHVELADVTLVEDGRRILAEVSVDLEAGSITYILGPSSEQRSALLRVLLGVAEPTSGSVTVDGADLGELGLSDIRERVAIALNNPWITAGTIADNIAFGHNDATRGQIVCAARLACVDSFTASWELGLDTTVTEEGPELTLGQRRLIALARAVVRKPDLLLIEDPTTGLDAQEETMAIKALKRVAEGRTTVVAAHRLHYARRPDRLLRLERGRVVEAPAAPPDAPTAPSTDRSARRVPRRLDVDRSVGALALTQPTIQGYEPVRLLERSSYTETWLAWQADTANRVLVKMARRAPITYPALEELSREFRTAEALRHPGLIRPVTADFGRAQPLAVYEYTEGRTLAELIELHGHRIPPDMLLRIGYELARILAFLHQRGYVHLDLRPEIVTVSAHGAIISDLKMVQARGAKPKRIYRQDQYGVLAAEQLRGAPAAASMDIFALGATLYQAVTGVLASSWSGTLDTHRRLGHQTASTVTRLGQAPPTRAKASSVLLNAIIDRFTEADPAQRPTATEALALFCHRVDPMVTEPMPRPAIGAGVGRPQLGPGPTPTTRSTPNP